MGTAIELKVAAVTLDYAKNGMGNDYGSYFQEGDLARRHDEGTDYDYILENGLENELPVREEAFVRPLCRVLPRLTQLRHRLDGARAEYDAATVFDQEVSSGSNGEIPERRYLSFDEFCSLANRYPVASLAGGYVPYDAEDRERLCQGRFASHLDLIERIPWGGGSDHYWSESSFFAAKICILSPASMLQVLGLNLANADAEVSWQFGPLVSSGWANRDSFVAGAKREDTVLVATEGASDARILRRALDILRPDITDFFRFIDVEERHHFWGTGNMLKFAEGLIRIDVQNDVIFLLDNDAEGVDADRKLRALKMPRNMRSMVLPSLPTFESFPARGPEGLALSNINGRAAAIECYLDLRLNGHGPAEVLWSNYKREIDAWHGALEHKESYTKHFMSQDANSMSDGSYDTSKINSLLDALTAAAAEMSAFRNEFP
ncbi:hypothetical protein J2Y54_000993 [Sphingomonas sp. BE123]|uniref:HEPN/Toprim-associated domain-containing protein n=1 Tax=Sphingomonas sp. BE123 TaxID=2817842 RepID=UPI00285613C1|nr:HEPN/Toprim-associated domain-containing protein [Sphingomonas sp. BE123]MDR6851500.1 hypothetical protein [Sphingomonas sp. BE123]